MRRKRKMPKPEIAEREWRFFRSRTGQRYRINGQAGLKAWGKGNLQVPT